MRVAAVILAAGESSRFGSAKQLARIGDETLLERAISNARNAGCARLVVVVGAHELAAPKVELVVNDQWRRGIGTSIRAGVRHLVPSGTDAVLLMTCDQPLITNASLQRLLKADAPIAAAEYAGTVGIPAFFARSEFEKLLALGDHEGAKRILLASGVARVPMPEAAADVDTSADLAQLLHGDEIQSQARQSS